MHSRFTAAIVHPLKHEGFSGRRLARSIDNNGYVAFGSMNADTLWIAVADAMNEGVERDGWPDG